MRVEATCSCGAAIAVEYEDGSLSSRTGAQQRGDEILEKFRRDHKACRVYAVVAKSKEND